VQRIFDHELLIRRKRRALTAAVPGAAFLLDRAVEDLGERLATVERRFDKAAALFCLTAAAGDAVLQSGKAQSLVRIEADAALFGGEAGPVGSYDQIPLDPESIDLAVSLLSLHEADDIPGALIQIRRALRPDGLFLGAMAGGGTLGELRESLLAAETELHGGASPRVAPFTDVRDAGALLQRAGFALPVADVETVIVRYDSLFGLMRDLRAMGASNALVDRSRRPASRRLFLRAAEIYAERFADADGRIRATFAFIWMSGWAPHASQQQPLKPGSATVSLTEVLK
jgi:SAM-dependent methyltransferase